MDESQPELSKRLGAGKKVRIRPLDNSDVGEFHSWWNDPEFAGQNASYSPMSFQDFQNFVKEGYFYIVEKKNDDKGYTKVGFVSYYITRSDYPYLYEIGYRIKANEMGQGYATEAVRLLVDYLFSTKQDIERLESVTDTDNIASQRVLEKNGFKREGKLRKRSRNKTEYRDEWIYGLLREERRMS